jgi:hypothetical protein
MSRITEYRHWNVMSAIVTTTATTPTTITIEATTLNKTITIFLSFGSEFSKS